MHTLFVRMVKYKLLALFPVDHLPLPVMCSLIHFCANIRHLLIIIIVIIYSLVFFTSALADGFSLEFEGQQISSSLQDSSQYSGCSQ